jgi:pimeloyl-ACP methyl ester carboxylesterase
MFQTATRVMAARRTTIKMVNAGTVTEADIWFEPSGRLLRISIPSQNVEVVREDIASVAVRHVLVSRPNDIAAKVQSTGFSIAATISRPETSAPRLPVVVLVSGSGPTDRDENLFGVPIFGQLANALADRGFAVVRYDKRGSGQSGGRPEAANIADYAEDLKAVVRTIRKRKDIDEDRVALVGYGEGGPIALTAARDGGVTALVLISAMGVPGAEYNLWQTTQALDRSDAPPNRRAETIELQKKIQSAVLTGTGWEGITPQVQEQADTPWFRTFLAFNPEVALRDVKKPVLVVHPLLDTETPPLHADRFEAMAGQRKNPKHAMKVVRVPGVNHLLVAASTGSIDEYPKLSEAKISPAVVDPLAGWLTDTFAAVR